MSLNLAPKNHVFYRNQNWNYPKIAYGKGVYLYDDKGKDYIDGCSGSAVANLGHGNEEIAEYAKDQLSKIAFTHLSRFTVDSIEMAADKIAGWMPKGLNHVYFVSGGSEAVETAIKMARQYFVERDGGNTNKYKVISKWNSFHGNTLGALSLTGIPGRRRIYTQMLMDSPKVTQFYHYRNPWNAKTLFETSVYAAKELENTINMIGAENISAFISEPVIGSALPGVHPDRMYFDMVSDICKKNDILLIIDEVMAGFGRTGEKLALDHYNVKPDIIVAAKGMSAGYTPLGATIASDKVFDTIMVNGSGKFVHGHTYAGNPLSTGIAYKVIDIMERDNIVKIAKENSVYFIEQLKKFEDFNFVGDNRGVGYLHGLEFVQNKETKEPFPASKNIAGKIMKHCLESGVVLYPGTGSVDGVRGDHVLIAPPINITTSEIDKMMNRMWDGFVKMDKELKGGK